LSVVIQSIFYAMGGRYIALVIQLASVMVVARLLSPEEIGIYSISASLFGFLLLIRDFGIGSYLIQEKNLTQDVIASAFTMSLALCWSLALFAFIVKPHLASFYNIPAMEIIISFLCVNLLIIPFGSITLSLLKREMKFDRIIVVDVGAGIANTVVTIVSAYNGQSYLSLAYGSLAGTIATVCIAMFFRPKNLKYLPNIGEIRSVASFGWKISGSNVFTQLQSSSPDLVVGKLQGPVEAVYFNKAISVFKLFDQIFQNALRPVYQSYMAGKNRRGADLKLPVLRASSIYLMLAWAFASFMQFNSTAVVLILFGDNWLDVVPLIEVMCLSHALNSLFAFHTTTLLGLGKANRVLRMSIILALAQFVVIIAYGRFDLIYIVTALISISFVRFLTIRNDLISLFGITVKDLFGMVKVPFVISVSIYGANTVALNLVNDQISGIFVFLLSVSITAAVLIGLTFILDNPLRDVAIETLKALFRKRCELRRKRI